MFRAEFYTRVGWSCFLSAARLDNAAAAAESAGGGGKCLETGGDINPATDDDGDVNWPDEEVKMGGAGRNGGTHDGDDEEDDEKGNGDDKFRLLGDTRGDAEKNACNEDSSCT